MFPLSPLPGVSGASAKDRTPAEAPTSAAEDGPLLPAQYGGADPAHVHVCTAGSLDGLHLVHHWQEGGGEQRRHLGYW